MVSPSKGEGKAGWKECEKTEMKVMVGTNEMGLSSLVIASSTTSLPLLRRPPISAGMLMNKFFHSPIRSEFRITSSMLHVTCLLISGDNFINIDDSTSIESGV